MSGWEGDLSQKQEAALAQFKIVLKDVMQPGWDDYFLLRWLRARNFDLKKSEKMLRDNVAWRKRIKADELPDWDTPEVIKKYFPRGVFGEDKMGCPLIIDSIGLLDLKGLFYSCPKKDIVKFSSHVFERMSKYRFPEQSKKHGKRIEQCTLISDFDHIGLKHLWKPAVDMYTETMAMLESNYPETLRRCYIINAPKIFPIIWNLLKHFMHEETRRKLKVYGRNYQKQLLEEIDADQLPKHWGGTRTDPDGDEFCKSQFPMGGKIPEKYQMKNIRDNIDMSNFVRLTVAKGSSEHVEYQVTVPGSSIRWQFLSEGNDIGFGIYKRTTDGKQKKTDMEEILKSERVTSHMVPEEGHLRLEQPGTYVVRFDNTYSWVTAKKIDYLVDILEPDDEMQKTAL